MKFLKLALFCGLATPIFVQPAQAQTEPRFEVATIKLADPNAVRNRVMPAGPDRLSIPSMTLRWLIYTAYQEGMGTSWNVSGGPDWVDQTAYAVEAKAAQPSTQKELRMMLRTLLEERFGLQVRQEARMGDSGGIYALVLDGDDGTLGPNIEEWDGTCGGEPPATEDEGDLFTPRCPSGYRPGGFFLEGGTLFSAGELLSLPPSRALLGTIVQDQTGLEGRYRLRLDYDFAPVRPGNPAGAPEFAGPSLFQAIREQWGLRLEKSQGVLNMVIVENVERPTEN